MIYKFFKNNSSRKLTLNKLKGKIVRSIISLVTDRFPRELIHAKINVLNRICGAIVSESVHARRQHSVEEREGGGNEGRDRYTCKSGLLDDAAAGIVREGRRSGDAPLPLLPVPLVARHPRAPGLLVLQGVVARPLPEALEETLLLGRVAALRA